MTNDSPTTRIASASRSNQHAGEAGLIEEAATIVIAFQRAVLKHWPILVATFVCSVAVGLVTTRMMSPVYQAAALLEFDPATFKPLGAQQQDSATAPLSYWDNKEYYETQYKILTSSKVLEQVIRDLGLKDPPDDPAPKPGALAPTITDKVKVLRKRITVSPIKSSRLVTVSVEHTDPKLARSLCDAVVRVYLQQNLEKTVSASSEAATWLTGQVEQYKGRLEADENLLHAFKEKNELPSTSINEASNMLRLEMQTYSEAVSKTRTTKEELLARNEELSKITAEDADVLPASELLANAFLGKLRDQYQLARQERERLIAAGKGANHPSVLSADRGVEQTRAALFAEVRNIQGAVARDLAEVNRQEKGDMTLYEGTRKRAVSLNMQEIEYHRLDRAREQDEKIYGMLLDRMKQADLARMMNINNVRLVDPPVEPRRPIRPTLSVNLGLAAAVGIFLGVVLAWLRDQIDSSIKTPEDVERRLGATFLGLLPEIGKDSGRGYGAAKKRRRPTAADLENPELVVHQFPMSGVAEAARSIRTNLLFMNPDAPYKMMLVSSAAPGEGKTTVACSIAIALAQGGQRVCIIDCDLRRPRLHRIFDRVGDAGITSALVGEATLDEVAKPTVIDNLWSIPAGPIPPNPTDLLHSERFKRLIAELRGRFDRVIIDSPPLVAVTDGAVIATLVDGTVFVTRSFRTTRQLARQGLRTLVDVDRPVIGVVLNAVDLNHREYSSYYYYYRYKQSGYAPLTPVGGTDGSDGDRSASPPN